MREPTDSGTETETKARDEIGNETERPATEGTATARTEEGRESERSAARSTATARTEAGSETARIAKGGTATGRTGTDRTETGRVGTGNTQRRNTETDSTPARNTETRKVPEPGMARTVDFDPSSSEKFDIFDDFYAGTNLSHFETGRNKKNLDREPRSVSQPFYLGRLPSSKIAD